MWFSKLLVVSTTSYLHRTCIVCGSEICSVKYFETCKEVTNLTKYADVFNMVLSKILYMWKYLFPAGEYKVDGTISTETGSSFNTDLKVTYGEKYVLLKSGLKRPSPSNLHANILLHPSQYPDFGVNLIWDYKRDKNNVGWVYMLII